MRLVLRTGPIGLPSVCVAIRAAARNPIEAPTLVRTATACGIQRRALATAPLLEAPKSPPMTPPTNNPVLPPAFPTMEPSRPPRPPRKHETRNSKSRCRTEVRMLSNARVQLQAGKIRARGEAARNPQPACQLQRSLYRRRRDPKRPHLRDAACGRWQRQRRGLSAGKYNAVHPVREDLCDLCFVAVEHVGCLWNHRGAHSARAPLQLL